MLEAAGKPAAAEYGSGDYDYRNLLARDDIDAMFVSVSMGMAPSTWVDAMRAGKIVEWKFAGPLTVEPTTGPMCVYMEETGVPIMMLENVCYRRMSWLY